MTYKYRVVRDYEDRSGWSLVKGEIVCDDDFHEPDIPANLVGSGVLEPADMAAESKRLSDSGNEKKPKIKDKE